MDDCHTRIMNYYLIWQAKAYGQFTQSVGMLLRQLIMTLPHGDLVVQLFQTLLQTDSVSLQSNTCLESDGAKLTLISFNMRKFTKSGYNICL